MPLVKSGSGQAFNTNVKTLMKDVGKSPHVKSRAQALAIAYDVKRRNRAEGGGIHTGPIHSTVPGRTDHHPMDVPAGAYVLTADHVNSMGEDNTNAGMAALHKLFALPDDQLRKYFQKYATKYARGGSATVSRDQHLGHPIPINAAGGEFVVPHEKVLVIGNGDIKRGHSILDDWQKEKRRHHIKTLAKLPGPAKD